MSKNLLLLLFLLLSSAFSFAQQEACETPEEDILDVNSITKCAVEDSKKTTDKKARQIRVKVSATRSRYLKKREALKKRLAVSSNANTIKSTGVNHTATTNVHNTSLELKKKIEKLNSNLSAEEVRKAEKFTTVDNIPLFESCASVGKSKRMDCFNTEMMKHIEKHFRYPAQAVRERIEGEVWVRFVIDKNGGVSNIKTLGPKGGEILKEEAMRVVANLPKFMPAKKNGDYASVKYGFPISFSLED